MKQFFPQDVVHLITEQYKTCEQNSMEYSQYHIIMYMYIDVRKYLRIRVELFSFLNCIHIF